VAGAKTPIATGVLTGSPTAQHPGFFTIPAGTFLTLQPPASPVVYTVHVTARNAGGPGAPSAPATITEEQSPPVNFGPFSPSPPLAAPEPGHPTAILIAYKPIAFSNWTAKWEGLVDLDFTNPGVTPTDGVFVRLSDLKQVLQQSDLNVFVPPLAHDAHFRVSVAMRQFLLTSDGYTSSWQGRAAKGLSLQVTTAKGGSPYFQPQSKLVLTGPTFTGIGDGSGSTSPPWIANVRTNLGTSDQSVAVGRDFIYTGDFNNFDVFEKNARAPVDLDHTALSRVSSPAKMARTNGGSNTLFKDFWYPKSVHDLNPNILPSDRPIPCDPLNPVYADGQGHGTLVNDVFKSACIDDVYDTRTTYDVEDGRFWIAANAGNALTTTQPCGDLAPADCAAGRAEATRTMLVAVSRSENPADGFYAYQVNTKYADWPMMAVHGHYAFFFYHSPNSMWVYDANQLTKGIAVQYGPPFPASAFNVSASSQGLVRFPKHHRVAAGVTFVLSANGPTLRANAFVGGGARPTLLNASTYTDPDGDIFDPHSINAYPDEGYDNYQAAVRGPYLYVACANGARVIVWRAPMVVTPDGGSVFIDNPAVKKWIITDTSGRGLHFDYSTIDVNANFDVVVSWRAWKPGTPNQVWFAVLYNTENAFRSPRPLSAPNKGGWDGRIDFVSSSVDPSDDETIWIMGADSVGSIVGSVRP
jgi:hypothetical protein